MSQYPNQPQQPTPGQYPPYQQPPQGQPPFQYPQQQGFPNSAWQQPMHQQYPPQYPPPQQPPPRKKNWIRRHPIWSILITSFVLSCIVGALTYQSSGTTTATNNAGASPTVAPAIQPTPSPAIQMTPTIQPTAKIQQIATPQPSPATTEQARLGASLGAFVAKYGQPNDHTDKSAGAYHFARYAGQNTDSIILNTDILDTGYSQKVEDVDATAPEGGWTQAQSDSVCLALLPLDAQYKSRVQLNSASGFDKVYYSASLAKMFPADAFTDTNNNPVKPGMFDVQYLTHPDGTLDNCELMVGTQQEI